VHVAPPREAVQAAPPPSPSASPPPPPSVPSGEPSLLNRWPDVIDHVKNRNPMLASALISAQPLAVENTSLVVAFASDFNRKSAESARNRPLIETAFQRVYGTPYRLRATVASGGENAPNLLDDPVINFAQRTFGGQPKRVPTD
jgi:hypothetical protein